METYWKTYTTLWFVERFFTRRLNLAQKTPSFTDFSGRKLCCEYSFPFKRSVFKLHHYSLSRYGWRIQHPFRFRNKKEGLLNCPPFFKILRFSTSDSTRRKPCVSKTIIYLLTRFNKYGIQNPKTLNRWVPNSTEKSHRHCSTNSIKLNRHHQRPAGCAQSISYNMQYARYLSSLYDFFKYFSCVMCRASCFQRCIFPNNCPIGSSCVHVSYAAKLQFVIVAVTVRT